MIGYDATWGAKRMDARAAYQKPGRVMFLRESRVGGAGALLQNIPLKDFYIAPGVYSQDLLQPVLDALAGGLDSTTDAQPVPVGEEVLVIVDWEEYDWDSGTASLDGDEGLKGVPKDQYDALLQWMWPQIVAQWRVLRPMARWSLYQCVQGPRWGGDDGWINNQQEDRSDEEAEQEGRGPWVSKKQGDPDSLRGWLYDLVDVLAVHCYHIRLFEWDLKSTEEAIREFHRDECRHGNWLSQTRYRGHKPVMPYVAWTGQGLVSDGNVNAVKGGGTLVTLDGGVKNYVDDLYRFARFQARKKGELTFRPAVHIARYDADSRQVTLRSAYEGGAIEAGWEYTIGGVPCRTQDARAWLEGYADANSPRFAGIGSPALTPWAMWGAVGDDEAAWATLGTLDERVSPAIAEHYSGRLGFVPALRVSR